MLGSEDEEEKEDEKEGDGGDEDFSAENDQTDSLQAGKKTKGRGKRLGKASPNGTLPKGTTMEVFLDKESGYNTKMNPYVLDEGHPAIKYRYTRYCFDKWVVNNEQLTDYEKGLGAQKLLKMIVLRRDYSSACPIGSDQTIGRNLPPLRHFSVERIFSPSAQELYNAFYKQWARRLVLMDEKTGRPIPNPRATRSINLLTFCPLLGYLHKSNPDYRPPPKEEETDEGSDYRTSKNKRRARRRRGEKPEKKTAESSLNQLQKSMLFLAIFKKMPKIGQDYRRWR